LLEAAHIMPDSKGGAPRVSNGLCLCKLHHAAFDAGLIGITPDLTVEVRPDVLRDAGTSMLVHGIQAFHGQHLQVVPVGDDQQPDVDALQYRYDLFRTAAA
jgi:putative restriction endonuclease